jgi:hypothetical protein
MLTIKKAIDMTSITISPVTRRGARTVSEKNDCRTGDMIDKFNNLTDTRLRLNHLERIRDLLTEFKKANTDKNARANYIHNEYRECNNFFNRNLGDKFLPKDNEGGLELNFGHTDNGYFTRSNDEAFKTILWRLINYTEKIVEEVKNNEEKYKTGIIKTLKNLIDDIRDLKLDDN